MCRRKGSKNRHALEVFVAVNGFEHCSESLSIAVVNCEVGDIFLEAVVAAGYPAVLVEHGWTVEPLASRDDKVVKFLHLICPCLIQLIKIEVEETGLGWTTWVC